MILPLIIKGGVSTKCNIWFGRAFFNMLELHGTLLAKMRRKLLPMRRCLENIYKIWGGNKLLCHIDKATSMQWDTRTPKIDLVNHA
jgi:hypothetical protein